MKETQLWSILYEILLGLNHIHQNNILHRDLKPLNIFMTSKQNIKIGDMGVSKIINSPENENQGESNDTKVGTPLYFAPELVKNKSYDYKIDIWAVGIIMYYLTALKPPFAGETVPELNDAIVNSTPKSLPKYYTTRYKTLVYSFLAKDPKDRPTSEEALKLIPDLIVNAYNSQIKFCQVREKFGAISSRESPTKNNELPLDIIPIPVNKKVVKMNSDDLKRPPSGYNKCHNTKSQQLNVQSMQNTRVNIKFAKNAEKMKVYSNIIESKIPPSHSNNEYWKPTIGHINVDQPHSKIGSERR